MGPHSRERARDSASFTSCCLTSRAVSRFSPCSAKCALRRRVYVVRAVENRRHSWSSVVLSSRGSAFHRSSRSRSRLAPLRQSLLSASFSASTTSFSLSSLAAAVRSARSALRAMRCWEITGPRASSLPDEGVQVTDGVGLGDLGAQGADRLGRLVGRHHAGHHPLLQQVHAARQLVVPLGEEGQGLLGRALGVLPDGPLTLGGPDVDGAVLGDASPVTRRHSDPLHSFRAVVRRRLMLAAAPRSASTASGAVPHRFRA